MIPRPGRPWKPAPPDPGIKPGGIRDRALRAIEQRSWLVDKEDRVLGTYDTVGDARKATREAGGERGR